MHLRRYPDLTSSIARIARACLHSRDVKVARKTYYGKSVVTVQDNNGHPVSGAIVTGDFSGPTDERKSATTGADGKAILTSTTVTRPRGKWCFAVSIITAPGTSYDASMNTVTSACEGGGGYRWRW